MPTSLESLEFDLRSAPGLLVRKEPGGLVVTTAEHVERTGESAWVTVDASGEIEIEFRVAPTDRLVHAVRLGAGWLILLGAVVHTLVLAGLAFDGGRGGVVHVVWGALSWCFVVVVVRTLWRGQGAVKESVTRSRARVVELVHTAAT